MTSMVETDCPFCNGAMDRGHLLRRPSGIDVGDFRLRWVTDGCEAVDEPIGEFKSMKGSMVSGYRCSNCRKIILDY